MKRPNRPKLTSIPTPVGVVVTRVPTENGGENVQIQETGGMDPLAVPTLLRLAADVKEASFLQREENQ